MLEEKKPRLNIDLPKDLHKEIKIKAIERNVSMRTWVLRAIMFYFKQEKTEE